MTSDDESIGRVDGFLADRDDVTAIIVRVSMPGSRHDVLVPFGSVHRVRNDRIELNITEDVAKSRLERNSPDL